MVSQTHETELSCQDTGTYSVIMKAKWLYQTLTKALL